jgi:hypothetical protein
MIFLNNKLWYTINILLKLYIILLRILTTLNDKTQNHKIILLKAIIFIYKVSLFDTIQKYMFFLSL